MLTNAKPILEAPEPGESVGYVESPPDAQPDEHGDVVFTLDQVYRRVAGGAARHPDDEVTALVAAALLTGASTDELLDALHRGELTQEIREQARVLFEGNQGTTRRDSFKNKARQMAALIWGHPIGRGDHTNTVTKEWQAAAWKAREWKKYGYDKSDIARRLNEEDAYLPEFKKRQRVTVADVQDLLSLEFEPY